MSDIDEMRRRRTFAIISHPDAGKTTVTEKLLLFGKATAEELIPATRATYDGPIVVGEDLMRFDIGADVTVTPFDHTLESV